MEVHVISKEIAVRRDQKEHFHPDDLQEKEKKKKSALVEWKGEDAMERLLQVWDCVSQDELGSTPQILAESKPSARGFKYKSIIQKVKRGEFSPR